MPRIHHPTLKRGPQGPSRTLRRVGKRVGLETEHHVLRSLEPFNATPTLQDLKTP